MVHPIITSNMYTVCYTALITFKLFSAPSNNCELAAAVAPFGVKLLNLNKGVKFLSRKSVSEIYILSVFSTKVPDLIFKCVCRMRDIRERELLLWLMLQSYQTFPVSDVLLTVDVTQLKASSDTLETVSSRNYGHPGRP